MNILNVILLEVKFILLIVYMVSLKEKNNNL
jgi:hypothetical protein